MRKVMVSDKLHRDGVWKMIERGEAIFHQFGCEYEEFQDGPGNYSVAIVEFADGSVETVMPSCIRFLDKGERK